MSAAEQAQEVLLRWRRRPEVLARQATQLRVDARRDGRRARQVATAFIRTGGLQILRGTKETSVHMIDEVAGGGRRPRQATHRAAAARQRRGRLPDGRRQLISPPSSGSWRWHMAAWRRWPIVRETDPAVAYVSERCVSWRCASDAPGGLARAGLASRRSPSTRRVATRRRDAIDRRASRSPRPRGGPPPPRRVAALPIQAASCAARLRGESGGAIHSQTGTGKTLGTCCRSSRGCGRRRRDGF